MWQHRNPREALRTPSAVARELCAYVKIGGGPRQSVLMRHVSRETLDAPSRSRRNYRSGRARTMRRLWRRRGRS